MMRSITLLIISLPVFILYPAKAWSGNSAPAMPGVNVPAIKVDTVGYPTGWKKMAVFNKDPQGGKLVAENGGTSYKILPAQIHAFGEDPASKDQVWQVDFSALTITGKYHLECPGAKSDSFVIGSNPYATSLKASIKMFYFQRCRTALSLPYAQWEGTSYVRKRPCHAHEDVGWDLAGYPEKKKRFNLVGGWHDAGNYDMYICSTAPTCQALLMACERHPGLFKDGDLHIPESGNGVPDILDECKWGLRWVLCMQGPDGGFRARDAVMQSSPEGPADEDNLTRWVAGEGTASTAKACAALSLAWRLYARLDPKFAKNCGEAALRAWDYLKKHPKHVVVDGKDSYQPLWDDGKDMPQEGGSRLAAAGELWRSFHKPQYLEAIQKYLAEPQTKPDQFLRGSWPNIARWPVMELAGDASVPVTIREDCKNRLLAAAESVRAMVERKDGYRSIQGLEGYTWSCNMIVAQEALLLSEASKLDPAQAWAREAARDQWHWLLGRNPNGYSMITRIGKEPNALYHCEWGKSEALPPGYLEGGPNSHEAGFLAPGAPAKCLLWDNPDALSNGLPAHHLWHSAQSELWEGHFIPRDSYNVGWWVVSEPDICANGDLVLAAAEFQD